MIKHSIILYFIILFLLLNYRPNLFNLNSINLPCVIVIVSLVSFYLVHFINKIKNKL